VKIYSFLLKRLAQLVALALVVTSATFALASLTPGDFFTSMQANPGVRPELVAELRRQYGLTEPMHLQYLHWLSRSLRLDLGFSLNYMRPVATVVAEALATTAWLGAPAIGVRPRDRIDLIAVRPGDRASGYPVAYDLRVMSSDDRALIVQIDEASAIAVALARSSGMLLVPLLQSAR